MPTHSPAASLLLRRGLRGAAAAQCFRPQPLVPPHRAAQVVRCAQKKGLLLQGRFCSSSASSVRPSDRQSIVVGDYVRVRDGTEAWREGFVVELTREGTPKVLVKGFRSPHVFSQVEKFDAIPAPEWAQPGDRVTYCGERCTVDRIEKGYIWVVRDAFYSKSEVCTESITPLEETFTEQVYFLFFRPTQLMLVIRREGVFCVGLYLLTRLPLFLLVLFLVACMEGQISTGYTRADILYVVTFLYGVGQVTRPFCAVASLFLAKRLRPALWVIKRKAASSVKPSPRP